MDGRPINLRFVKFQNVQNLTFFIKDNQGDTETTQVDYLCLAGTPINTTKMSDFKREIFAFFTDAEAVETLFGFLALEEKRGRDKFNSGRFTLFKGCPKSWKRPLMPRKTPAVVGPEFSPTLTRSALVSCPSSSPNTAALPKDAVNSSPSGLRSTCV